MYTIKVRRKSFFLTWQFVAFKLLFLAALAIWLGKPTGTIEGSIALEMPQFGLSTYDMGSNHVYAIAIGPRGDQSDERGVWIKQDGSFRIDQLPVGEYQLKVRAPGFGNEYQSGIFVDEAKVTRLREPIRLAVLQPSISIASNRRVFTTRETPNFWINATGSAKLNVQVYKKDLMAKTNRLGFGNFTMNTGFTFSKNISGTAANPFPKEAPLMKFVRELHTDWEDSANAQFKLEKPLPPGEYVIVAEGYSFNGATLD
ncbi:MAG TPA: carboxypeptidase-like regulatory domain-containing protein, partial [Chroococcales cyanobacterium]